MKMNKLLTLSIAAATSMYAGGYKIPEQSLKGTALGAAYIANANGADASYYNPANMVFSSKGNQLDLGLSLVKASNIKFSADAGVNFSGESEKESELIPTLHYIFPTSFKDVKFGFSMIVPAGLSKRWESGFAKTFAEQFTVEVVEINPTIAYKINDQFAIGAGLRALHTSGVVKSDGLVIVKHPISGATLGTSTLTRELEGDSIDYGYNLALTYKPLKDTTLAATYRSKVDLTIKGDATLSNTAVVAAGVAAVSDFDSSASVQIPMPAALNLAVAQTFGDFTAELVYERTYWSSYSTLDFNYGKTLPNSVLIGAFDEASTKDWKDTNTYKLGLTYKASKDLTIMGAYGIDESPVPDETIGFELPDSDAKIYSLGFNYKINDTSSFGMAYLLSKKENRSVDTINDQAYSGEFTNSKVSLLTFGYSHQF